MNIIKTIPTLGQTQLQELQLLQLLQMLHQHHRNCLFYWTEQNTKIHPNPFIHPHLLPHLFSLHHISPVSICSNVIFSMYVIIRVNLNKSFIYMTKTRMIFQISNVANNRQTKTDRLQQTTHCCTVDHSCALVIHKYTSPKTRAVGLTL